VARFYWEHLRSKDPIPNWPAWAERWDEIYPDKEFPTWRHFREYLTRGVKAALPYYKFPEPKPGPEMQAARDELMENLTRSLSRPGAAFVKVMGEEIS
jgi:hypothetical protein